MKPLLAAVLVAATAAACGPKSGSSHVSQTPAPQQALAWRPVGSWSGHGNLQTGSFESGSGQLRVRWKTTKPLRPGAGTFQLAAHSAISGRVLDTVVDTKGAAEGTGYVDQDPHVFYMEVESTDLDWTFAVDEAVAGTIQGVLPRSRGDILAGSHPQLLFSSVVEA